MAYVPVPKDLSKIKTKVAFNLTKRQLVCFGGGALIGVPLFFLLKGPVGTSTAAMCMMVVMLPFFLFAMYEKHGQPLEKILGNIIRVSVDPAQRTPYRTNNFYAVLERQANLGRGGVTHCLRQSNAGCTGCSEKTRNKLCSRSKQRKSCPAPIKSRSRLRLPVQTARTKRKNPAQDSIPYETDVAGRYLPCGQTAPTQKPSNSRTSTTSSRR